MSRYRFAPEADQDLDDIFNWLVSKSPSASSASSTAAAT